MEGNDMAQTNDETFLKKGLSKTNDLIKDAQNRWWANNFCKGTVEEINSFIQEELDKSWKAARLAALASILQIVKSMNSERIRDEKEGIKHTPAQEYNAIITTISAELEALRKKVEK